MKDPASLYICWYKDQVPTSYDAFKMVTTKLDRKDKNTFSKNKKIVEVMEEYAGDCPQVRAEESGGIEALSLWEISVVEIANLAVERAKEYLGKSTIGKADFKKKPSLLGETI
jgi:hypothetical protein